MIQELQAWVASHPALMAAIVWPFVLGIVSLVLKPRSPDAYARIAASWPRVAAALKAIAALGIDPSKVVAALQQVVTGSALPAPMMMRVHALPAPTRAAIGEAYRNDDPPDTPKSTIDVSSMLPGVAAVLFVSLLGLHVIGCSSSTRQTARDVIAVADAACVIAKVDLADSKAIAEACGIEHELVPVIDPLLASQRAQLAAHGVVLRPLSDGGNDG